MCIRDSLIRTHAPRGGVDLGRIPGESRRRNSRRVVPGTHRDNRRVDPSGAERRARVDAHALLVFFFMMRQPPRSTLDRWSAASEVYKGQPMLREAVVWKN